MVSRAVLVKTTLAVIALMWASAACIVQARGGAVAEARALEPVWTLPVPGAATAVRATVEKGGPDVLVIIGNASVVVVSAEGKVLQRADGRSGIVVGATGDVDGDGGDDVLVARRAGDTILEALRGRDLSPLWSVTISGATPPARILTVDLDGDGRRDVVLGESGGMVRAFSSAGKPLWSIPAPTDLSGETPLEIRGLEDVKTRTGHDVAVAWMGGRLALFDAKGKELWTRSTDRIRRMRAFDVDGDGVSEILYGCESGGYTVQDVRGNQVLTWGLGEAVLEIRAVETDGNPKMPEVAIGGKKGLSRVMSGTRVLAEMHVGERVTAIGGVDADGDGRDEILIGTDQGSLNAYRSDGTFLVDRRMGGKVEAITWIVSPLRDRLAVVADGQTAGAYRLHRQRAASWYSPYTAGALGSLFAIGIAFALLRQRPPEPPPPPPPGTRSRLRALSERLGRLEALSASGRLPREAIADRVAQIKAQIEKARNS
jgi:hypothetical protein